MKQFVKQFVRLVVGCGLVPQEDMVYGKCSDRKSSPNTRS